MITEALTPQETLDLEEQLGIEPDVEELAVLEKKVA